MARTILFVDDFQNTRHVIRFTLERGGYAVLEAASGVEALKLFDGRKIDLLITDYNMPQMDGVTFAGEVRKMPAYQFIPILVLTTEIDPTKKLRAKEVGITGWVQKPFSVDKFLELIKKIIV